MATQQPGCVFVNDDDHPTIKTYQPSDDTGFVVVHIDGRTLTNAPGEPLPAALHFSSAEAVMQWAHRLRLAAEDTVVALDHARGLVDDEAAS